MTLSPSFKALYDAFESPGAKDVVPAKEGATDIAYAILELIRTDKALDKAKDKVPSYTGQYDPPDYYAREQEEFNRACDEFLEALTKIVQK
jgi:hypothetical protein